MTYPTGILGVPIIKEQKDLILDLVRATITAGPNRREPFTALATATTQELLLMHPGIPDDHPGALRGDIGALAGEGLIQVESDSGSQILFAVTAKGIELAAALEQTRATGGHEPQWVAGTMDDLKPTRNAALREWGTRWVAIDAQAISRRGQSRLWSVWDKLDDATKPWKRTKYVLKELYGPASASSTKYKRFVREIEQTKLLSEKHSGIVSVIDYGVRDDEHPETPFYVMLAAETSVERAKDLTGRLEYVLEIGIAVADALIIAHEDGVVHRDVKPGNILLYGDERHPALADFGICFIIDEDRLTGMNAETVGSRDFVAPELLGGGQIDDVGPKADIYSLGKTLYAMVRGGTVFPREAHHEPRWNLAEKLADQRLAHLHGLLGHMVTEDADERYASMTVCRDALVRALGNVRQNIPWTPGMYGSGESPRERHTAIRVVLDQPSGTKRFDSIHTALDRAFDAANARASRFEREYPSMAHPVGQPHEGALSAAVDCADELVAVGLPLVRHDETDVFEEWLVRATEPAIKDGNRFAPAQQILAGAGVLAAYIAAALSWRQRRHRLLRILVDRHISAGPNWIYLDLLEGNSGRLLRWILTALPALTVVRYEDLALLTAPAPVVSVFPGLVAIKDLLNSSNQVLASLDRVPLNEVDLLDFPMCYVDGTGWATTLAGACVESPGREREIAKEIFQLTPEAFRDGCKRVTPVLAALTSRLNRGVNRRITWNFSVDGNGLWKRWCHGEPNNSL